MGTRADKSLGLMTKKFIRLLQTARGGLFDLNTVLLFSVHIKKFGLGCRNFSSEAKEANL